MKKTLSIPDGVFFLYKLLIFTSKVYQYEAFQNSYPVPVLSPGLEFLLKNLGRRWRQTGCPGSHSH